MKYKAKRPCKFAGRTYLIGEVIADGVVQEMATARLLKADVIEAVDAEGATPPLPSTLEEKPKDEPMTPEVVDGETETPAEEAEGAYSPLEFTVDNLVGLKKSELLELAESYGLELNKLKVKNKAEIAQAVLEVVKDDL